MLHVPDDHDLDRLLDLEHAYPGQEIGHAFGRLPLIAIDLELVEVAAPSGLEPRVVVRDDPENDFVEVVLVRRSIGPPRQPDRPVGIPGGEPVRPAPHGMAIDLAGLCVSVGGRRDDRHHEREDPLGVRFLESHAHRRRVRGLDPGEILESPAPVGGVGLGIVDPLDREAHVVGGHGLSVLPGRRRVEMKLVDEAVVRDAPGFREPGHELQLLVDADERPEHHRGHARGFLFVHRDRVERRRVAGEVAGDRGGRRGRRFPAPAGRRQNDRDEHTEGEQTETKTLHRWRRTE